ncbi:hypothetical protein D8S78_12500 [Natrialba swarupiae]|nr:hypothetical protein [Natrialba swarupiae]
MVNIGDVDVFAHATTYPIIMVMEGLNREGIRSAEDFVVDDYRFSYVAVNESMEDWIESDAISGWDSGNRNRIGDLGKEQNHRVVDLLTAAPG